MGVSVGVGMGLIVGGIGFSVSEVGLIVGGVGVSVGVGWGLFLCRVRVSVGGNGINCWRYWF